MAKIRQRGFYQITYFSKKGGSTQRQVVRSVIGKKFKDGISYIILRTLGRMSDPCEEGVIVWTLEIW